MDLNVYPNEDGKSWRLTDLLGRTTGSIQEGESGWFISMAVEGVGKGPHRTLDAALREIEKTTRSTCRVVETE